MRSSGGGWDLCNLVTGARQPESGGLRTENQENLSHSRGLKDSLEAMCVVCAQVGREAALWGLSSPTFNLRSRSAFNLSVFNLQMTHGVFAVTAEGAVCAWTLVLLAVTPSPLGILVPRDSW